MGGMTNLKNMWHRPIHDELYKDSTEVKAISSSTLDNFVSKHITPLSQSFEKAKKLTRAVCEMIARDICPISIVNDIGFLNLLKEAEPCYVISCKLFVKINTPIISSTDQSMRNCSVIVCPWKVMSS